MPRLSRATSYSRPVTQPTDPFAAPPAPTFGQGQPPVGDAQPGAYGQTWGGSGRPGPYGGLPQTSTKAIVALALAIAAYTPVIPFVGAVIALFVASSAKREILTSGGRQTGLDLCTWARVLAIVHLVFVGLLLLLVLPALVVLPFSFS